MIFPSLIIPQRNVLKWGLCDVSQNPKRGPPPLLFYIFLRMLEGEERNIYFTAKQWDLPDGRNGLIRKRKLALLGCGISLSFHRVNLLSYFLLKLPDVGGNEPQGPPVCLSSISRKLKM